MSTCTPCVHRLLQETSTAVAENLRKQFSGLAGTLHATLLQRDSLSWAVQQTLQQQVTCCLAYPLHAPVRAALLEAWHCPINCRSKVMLTAGACRAHSQPAEAARALATARQRPRDGDGTCRCTRTPAAARCTWLRSLIATAKQAACDDAAPAGRHSGKSSGFVKR
jgi:hypothetical protein